MKYSNNTLLWRLCLLATMFSPQFLRMVLLLKFLHSKHETDVITERNIDFTSISHGFHIDFRRCVCGSPTLLEHRGCLESRVLPIQHHHYFKNTTKYLLFSNSRNIVQFCPPGNLPEPANQMHCHWRTVHLMKHSDVTLALIGWYNVVTFMCMCSLLTAKKEEFTRPWLMHVQRNVSVLWRLLRRRDLIAFDTMSASDLNHVGRKAGTSPRVVRRLSPVKVPLNPRGLWRIDPGSQAAGLRRHSARVQQSNPPDSAERNTPRNHSRSAPGLRSSNPMG